MPSRRSLAALLIVACAAATSLFAGARAAQAHRNHELRGSPSGGASSASQRVRAAVKRSGAATVLAGLDADVPRVAPPARPPTPVGIEGASPAPRTPAAVTAPRPRARAPPTRR